MNEPALVLPAVSHLPPSFDGSAWGFGWALFSLTAMSTFSLAIMGQLLTEVRTYGLQIKQPAGIARAALFCLLLTIFMGSIGDVVFLYLWNEVSPRAIGFILEADRWLDALTILPFAGFGYLLTRGRPVVLFQLLKQPIPTDLWPTWPMVRQQLGVMTLVMFIAMGVTLAK